MAKEKPLKPTTTTTEQQAQRKKKSSKSSKRKRLPLGPNRPKTKSPKQKKGSKPPSEKDSKLKDEKPTNTDTCRIFSPDEQRKFFLGLFESANGIKLSSLELESIKDTCFIELSENISLDAINLGKHVKDVFASSWKEALCESQLIEGQIDPGNPAVLVVSSSAIRSLELLRGFRPLTKECQAVKLFSKHIKIEDQVAQLKNRVNIASGTPSRIKKLCEMEALGLSRLSVIVLDMHTDVKGYSLLTLPQVRDEFWDLYKTYFHKLLVQGNLRVCLYGPISTGSYSTLKRSGDQ